jgi:hypothetical protein
MSTDQPGTPGPDEDPALHADLPADAASSGTLPEDAEPTPGSDNDGAEAGYTSPSAVDGSDGPGQT